MLHPFNRSQLLATCDLEELNQVREALMEADIECQYRMKTMKNPAFFSETRRAKSESIGIRTDISVQYKLYVHKNDLNRAKAFL